jgi:hypothetical protein
LVNIPLSLISIPKFLIQSTFLRVTNYPLCDQYQSKYWKGTDKQIWKHGKED